MKWLAALLLCVSCATTPEQEVRPLPDDYTICRERYDHTLCCPRDFKTHKIIGPCKEYPK